MTELSIYILAELTAKPRGAGMYAFRIARKVYSHFGYDVTPVGIGRHMTLLIKPGYVKYKLDKENVRFYRITDEGRLFMISWVENLRDIIMS